MVATSRQAPPPADATSSVFAVLMGPNVRKTMPRFLERRKKSAYLFDSWPHNHEKIRLFADACRIDHLFVSSSQAAKTLSDLVASTACHWVPEGITPGEYRLPVVPEKTIDVLQLGRRYDTYHQMIAGPLEKGRKVYLYEKVSSQLIFPERAAYIEGLARSKISICVPVSITHPKRAGGIETMTVRYLQSMVSKCLVVGHAPAEMIQLFGYNPLVEIDYSDPAAQLLKLLDRLPDYQPLIEKNYQRVHDEHTWAHRWESIRKILDGKPAA